jgi:hypothetical protein
MCLIFSSITRDSFHAILYLFPLFGSWVKKDGNNFRCRWENCDFSNKYSFANLKSNSYLNLVPKNIISDIQSFVQFFNRNDTLLNNYQNSILTEGNTNCQPTYRIRVDPKLSYPPNTVYTWNWISGYNKPTDCWVEKGFLELKITICFTVKLF